MSQNRGVYLLLLVCSPLIVAPYYPGCNHFGATTTLCDPHDGACAPIGGSSSADAQARLTEAGATGLLTLGVTDWSNLELCGPCARADCSDQPATTFPVSRITTCTFLVPGGTSSAPCRCVYDTRFLKNMLTSFGRSTSDGKGRHLAVQLAPIFTFLRKVPPYLTTTKLDDPKFIAAYKQLWTHLWTNVFAPLYTGDDGPGVLVSIGNEVNGYLDAPLCAHAGCEWSFPDADAGPDRAWQRYEAFVAAVAPFIKASSNHILVSATTMFRGGSAPWRFCGLGDWLPLEQGGVNGAGCPVTGLHMLVTYASLDLLDFTYYPDANLALRSDATAAITSRIATDFDAMRMIGDTWLPSDRYVVLQEVGFPSRHVDAKGAIVDRQAAQSTFVQQIKVNWKRHRDWIFAVNFQQLHDFTQQLSAAILAPLGACQVDLDCKKVATSMNVIGNPFRCEARECTLRDELRPCLTDAQCVAQTGGLQLQCLSGRCGQPSACDQVTAALPACWFDASKPCTCTTDSQCGAGFVCATTRNCAAKVTRTWACSWGLLDENGTPKQAWTEFKRIASYMAAP